MVKSDTMQVSWTVAADDVRPGLAAGSRLRLTLKNKVALARLCHRPGDFRTSDPGV